mmetsp:Transcript_59590/g.119626  ORF Transcript_59590/g.119626 Transcript_59590/m.119626 type:complete len:251 (-) Transcript_59590:1782-2534(-)
MKRATAEHALSCRAWSASSVTLKHGCSRSRNMGKWGAMASGLDCARMPAQNAEFLRTAGVPSLKPASTAPITCGTWCAAAAGPMNCSISAKQPTAMARSEEGRLAFANFPMASKYSALKFANAGPKHLANPPPTKSATLSISSLSWSSSSSSPSSPKSAATDAALAAFARSSPSTCDAASSSRLIWHGAFSYRSCSTAWGAVSMTGSSSADRRQPGVKTGSRQAGPSNSRISCSPSHATATTCLLASSSM